MTVHGHGREMMMSDVEDPALVVESLRNEIEALRSSSEKLLFSFDRIINFALIFLVGGVGLALTKGHFIIMALMPFPVVIILGYLEGSIVEGLSRAGHKRFLEERLNSMIGPVYLEEEYVAPKRQGSHKYGRLGVAMMQLMLALLLVGLFVVGFIALLGRPVIYQIVYAVFVAYSSVNLGSAVAESRNSYKQAYDAAKSSLEDGKVPRSALIAGSAGGRIPDKTEATITSLR
jgi:hypothetical protein